ncbi:hypothetical protein ANRL4_05435 [Anaerolineae bacterium]|nr:hypothetical protein ANRL4_05435 [Anaerolineae bacterium]
MTQKKYFGGGSTPKSKPLFSLPSPTGGGNHPSHVNAGCDRRLIWTCFGCAVMVVILVCILSFAGCGLINQIVQALADAIRGIAQAITDR